MFRDLVNDLDNYSPVPDQFLDVPFVPTDDRVIEAMLAMAQVGPDDLLYDLGCGDGRIVVAAARDRGARAIGVEIDTVRIADAMEYAGNSRVEFQVDFIEENIFTVDFSDATVVTLYLLDAVNVKLRPRLLSELRPGTRIVSQTFDMGDWEADEKVRLSGVNTYKWVVPARVEGVWEWEGSDGTAYHIELQQKYQAVTGSAWVGGEEAHLDSATLCGNSLKLSIRAHDEAQPIGFMLDFQDDDVPSVLEDPTDFP